MNLLEKWPREKALCLRNIIQRMGSVCGCGNSTEFECILELLKEAENHTENGFYRDKWFEFAAKVLDSWDILEHGSSIGFAWLTEDGKLLLEFLNDFGTESYNMEDDSGHPEWAHEFGWDTEPADWSSDSYLRWEEKMKENMV